MFQESTEEFVKQVELNPYDSISQLEYMVIYKSETYTIAGELVDAKLITPAKGCIFISLYFVN